MLAATASCIAIPNVSIADAIQSVPLADIDPEEFYDFTVSRPDVALTDGNARHIEWPTMEFRYGPIDGSREVIIGTGAEPHLRWRSFCDCVLELAQTSLNIMGFETELG